MKRVLITGLHSYVGTQVKEWLLKEEDNFCVDAISVRGSEWKKYDFTPYDVVFHVAGIAHVDAKKSMENEYRKVNTNLTIEVALKAKQSGVRQFIFMSSGIVYHESQSLKGDVIDSNTQPDPNTFYGDSKLQAEIGIQNLEDKNYKVAIIRAPMIYGPSCKGNFLRLAKLATITPIFPDFHNKRSMVYIDNLCEFVKQIIIREERGIFHPDNEEYADTVEIVKYFAKKNNHKLFVWHGFNVFVHIGSHFLKSINKMFADSYYSEEVRKVSFKYQVVSLEESLSKIDVSKASLTKMG